MASPSSATPAATAARRRVFETVLREQSLHAYLPPLVNPSNRICFKRFAYKRNGLKTKRISPAVFDFVLQVFFAKRHAATLVCYVSSTSEYGILQFMSMV